MGMMQSVWQVGLGAGNRGAVARFGGGHDTIYSETSSPAPGARPFSY